MQISSTDIVIERAFTTRIPLAVMIVMGIKQWENRAAMPWPAKGVCGMSCSKGSDAREYAGFLNWAAAVLPDEIVRALPIWEQVADWRGKLVAVCDYSAGIEPGPRVWDEGYAVWWKLENVRLLKEAIPVKGSIGMWRV